MDYQNNDINEMVKDEVVDNKQAEVVSVKRYLLYMFLFSIPVVGLVVLIVKFFDNSDKNISNYAKAQLLLSLIGFVVGMIMISLLYIYVVPNIMDELDYSDAYEEGYEFDFGEIEDYFNNGDDENNNTNDSIVDDVKPIIG